MKKIVLIICQVLCVWGFEGGGANRPKLLLDIKTGMEYYQYKEPKLMKITGAMFVLDGGVGVSYKLFKAFTDVYYATDVGINRYDGGFYNSETKQVTPTSTKSRDWYVGWNLKTGVTLYKDDRELVFLYAGLGYRFLHNLFEDKPGMKAAYTRDQGYLYLPVGLSGEIPVYKNFALFGTVEHRFLLYGHHKSGMKDLGYDDDLYFKQKDGFGGKIELGGKFYFSKNQGIKISLYYDFWHIQDSNRIELTMKGAPKGTFVEPRNKTNAVGMTVGYSF